MNGATLIISLIYFLSQFYILPSGLPQLSHFLIFLVLIFFLIKYKMVIPFDNRLFVLFLLCCYVLIVNFLWILFSGSSTYFISTIYWVFNLLLYIYFISLKEIDFNFFQKIIFFSFATLIFLWGLGLGGYEFFPRYNGFFNDPNQMAFWVLCSLSIFMLRSNKIQILVIFMGLFLIILTMSRSAILGFGFIVLSYLLQGSFNYKTIIYKFISLSLFVLSALILFLISSENINIIIERFSETDVNDQAEIRGYTALSKYPEYLFFGAGQGEYYRFSPTNHEIHSTWAGVLFYYGVVGLSFFLLFLFSIFYKLKLEQKVLFLAPLVYSFSTYGARTSIFWIFLSIFVLHVNKKIK